MGREFYPPSPPPPRTVIATVAAPLTCARCGYDLRASPSNCPECGLDVAETVRRRTRTQLLRQMSRRARRPAIVGVGCVFFGAILSFGLVSTVASESVGADMSGEPFVFMRLTLILERLLGVLFLLGGLASLAYHVVAVRRGRGGGG